MAELRNDILKEEEQIGGFTPGEPDDDSFKLQDKSYTGNIFLFLNPLVPEPEEIEEEPLRNVIEDEEEILDEPEVVPTAPRKSEYKMMDIGGDESEDDLFEFEKKKLHKITEESEEIDDPNLVGYIKGLLSVSKRKNKNQQQNDSNKEEVEIKPFNPIVGNSADTQLVISDMDLDKPSTSTIGDRNISEEDNPIPEATFEPEVAEPEKPKEKKKKKKLPLIFWLSAAALLILVLGAGAYFWLFNSVDHSKDTHTKISAKDSIKLAEKLKKDKVGEKSDSLGSKNNKIPDSLKLAEKNHNDSINNAETKFDEKIADKSKEIEVINEMNKSADAKNNFQQNKDIAKQEPKSVPVPVERMGDKPSNPVDIKKSNTDLAEKLKQIDKKAVEGDRNITKPEIRKVPEKLKKVDLATAKPVKPLDIKQKALSETYQYKDEPKESTKETPKDIPGIYIVQIYSSPSKEDAQLWLNKLKARNVQDGFISEQTMRDKIWYRVRFGNFRTREEARIAALRFGFAQTWIDRVK